MSPLSVSLSLFFSRSLFFSLSLFFFLSLSLSLCPSLSVDVYTQNMHAHTYECLLACMHACMHACMYVCTSVGVCIYTRVERDRRTERAIYSKGESEVDCSFVARP